MHRDNDNEQREPIRPLSPAVESALAATHASFLRFLERSLGSAEEATDVMQDFYLRVLERSGQLRREQSVRAWMHRVLRNVLNDSLRRRAARQRAEADFARKQIVTDEVDDEIDKTVCMCLYNILPVLRPEYADIVRRIELENEPRDSVARSLNITMSNVKVRLHRARRALRDLLLLTCETCPIHGFLDCGCDYTRNLLLAGRGGKESRLKV